MRKRFVVFGLACALAFGVIASTPRVAQAQSVTPTGAFPQGMVGTGLIGAEAVILIEGAVGLRNPWILLGSGALGLVAGGIGGYFIDHTIDSMANNGNLPMVSSGLLVLGLGLVIPTAIMFVGATMYRPEDTRVDTDDSNASGAPLEESVGANGSNAPSGDGTSSGDSSGASPSPGGGGGGRRARRPIGPEALINIHTGRMHVGVPNLSVGSTYTIEEQHHYGVVPQTEWRVPLLSASF